MTGAPARRPAGRGGAARARGRGGGAESGRGPPKSAGLSGRRWRPPTAPGGGMGFAAGTVREWGGAGRSRVAPRSPGGRVMRSMRPVTVFGLILLAIGILALAYQGMIY